MKKKLLLLIFTIFTFINLFNIHQLNAVGQVYQGIANYESGSPTILYRTTVKPAAENITMLKNKGLAYNTWNYSLVNQKITSTKKTYEARYLIFTKDTIGKYSNASTTKGTNTGYGYLDYEGAVLDFGLQNDKSLGEFFEVQGGTIGLKTSNGSVKYLNKNENIDKWLFDYSSVGSDNNYTAVTHDISEWNNYIANIYELDSSKNVLNNESIIKWSSIANNNVANNWEYRNNLGGKNLPGVPYTEYRIMLFNPTVASNTSSVLTNSVYVADMILNENVTQDLSELGKSEVYISTLSQTLSNEGEAWLITPGSFLHGITAIYNSNNWSEMTRGVDVEDPFALGAGLNLWDNTLQLPTGGTTNSVEVLVRHVNVTKNERGRKQYKLIDRTNHYSVTQPNKGGDLEHSLWSWDYQYQELVSIPSTQTKIGIKTLNKSKTYVDEDGNNLIAGKYEILGYDVASFNSLDEMSYIGFPGPDKSIGSQGININLEDYDGKYIYVDVYYQSKEEPEEEKQTFDVIERHVLVNNSGAVTTVLEETTHSFEEGEYTSSNPKVFYKKYNSYEYVGYSLNSSSTANSGESYKWHEGKGNVTVTFKYKKQETIITKEAAPAIDLNGLLEIESAQGFNKKCDDIESVPGNAKDGDDDLAVGITGIPSYILGGVEVKDVTRSGTLTYNITMKFASKSKTWEITVPYSTSRIAIENILIYRLSDPTIYNTDKGYDTYGSSVFDWTSKSITNPKSLTYDKETGSNNSQYIVNSPSDIYTYYYNYNNKEAHGVQPRQYKVWYDGYGDISWTDELGSSYIAMVPQIDIEVNGNTLYEGDTIDSWFDTNNKTVNVNINLLNEDVYDAINYYTSGNTLNETDLTQIGNKVTELISSLKTKVSQVNTAWNNLSDAEYELEEAEANRIPEPTASQKPSESDYGVDSYREELQRNAFEKIYYYYYNSWEMNKDTMNEYYRIDTTKNFNVTSDEFLWNALQYILNKKNYTADFIRFNIWKTGSTKAYAYTNDTYAISTYTEGTDNYENYCKPYYNCLDKTEYEYIKNTNFNTADNNYIEDWSDVSWSDYADDHNNYVYAKYWYDVAIEQWEEENEDYEGLLKEYNRLEGLYNNALSNYYSKYNDYYSKLEDYNEVLSNLESLAIRENYARTYYDEAVALQGTYDTFSSKTAKQIASIFNLQVYLESANDDASVGSNGIFNKSLFNMESAKFFTISDYLTTYGTSVPGDIVKIETDYPRINKELYTDGFDYFNSIGEYDKNKFEIPKTKLNGERILAGYIRYRLDTESNVSINDDFSVQNFNDNVYYDNNRTNQKVFTVDGGRVIEKNYGVSKNNSQKFNIYTPLVVGADVELEQDVVDQTVNNPYSTTDVIQANSAFTINFKTNYKDVDRDNVYGVNKNKYEDFTSRYRLKYYIRFDFDVNNVKYINENGSMQTTAYVSKNKWIGPIYGDSITAVPYYSTSADESFGENANGYYIIAVAVNARESWTALLKDYLTDAKTLEDIVNEGNVSKIGDITNICGVEPGDISYYADYEGKLAIINRMYDFRVTDVADVNWKNVFRENSSGSYVNQHSGLAYYAGLTKWNTVNTYKYNEIVGRTEEEIGSGSVLRILPVGPYKNTSSTYISAPRLGYKFSFDFKVTGATNSNKYVVITPTFYYISKDGKTFINNVDLYYKNSNGKYVKVGSASDKYNIQFTPNDGYRALIKTDERNLSNKSISIGNLTKLILNFKDVSTYSKYSSTITYYGEYKLPNSTIAITSDGNINNPLKDGYVGVRFDILANEANNGSDSTTLRYGKDALNDRPNTSQWDFEGYLGITDQGSSYSTTLRLEKGTWSIDNDTYNKIKGTVILYDLDHRASNDFN